MPAEAPKKVLFTGASTGIGLAIIQRLCDSGCDVWGTSRDTNRLPQLPRFHPIAMDLLQPDSIRRAFATAREQSGGFDVLINNAGAAVFGPTNSVPLELAREQFQLLVEGPMELIRLALPDLLRHKTGTIINITSLAAVFPVPYMAAYNAAKAALSSYTRCLRLELPLRIVEIQPGDINTGFHNSTKRLNAPHTNGVWQVQTETMAAAPGSARVADAVWCVLRDPNPPPVLVVGSFAQARLAPLAARLLPARLMEWVLRRHYRL
ncbi:MAG: SDR family NAD(P)-dependent oxidoreductase [Verrucomicrobiota bacterium]|jgi:short-subunit dehydrogenase